MRPTGAPSKGSDPPPSIAKCRAAIGLGGVRTRSRFSSVSSTPPDSAGLDTRKVVVDLLHAPQPIVSPLLGSPQ
jgi:hypothetical protein